MIGISLIEGLQTKEMVPPVGKRWLSDGDSVKGDERAAEIAKRLTQVRAELEDGVTLIVVTKNFPISDIEILYKLGERNFGENRVQELAAKRDSLNPDIDREITWHFQGGIQSNKTSSLNRYADVIHSIDSLKVLDRIDPEKQVFLQINLDSNQESTSRSGIARDEVDLYAARMWGRFRENFLGVMGVAPHFPGVREADIEQGFKELREISIRLRDIAPSANSISAGMSDDYRLALANGATHIRLGSSILGRRDPTI
jgi:PLP dependent protein